MTTSPSPNWSLRLIWQPKIGCKPNETAFSENSNAPNILLLSAIHNAG